MTAEDHTHAFISVSPTRNLIAQASAVHRQTSASTSAGVAPKRTHAFAGFGRGSIVTGSTSSRSSALESDCRGPASAAIRSRIRVSIR